MIQNKFIKKGKEVCHMKDLKIDLCNTKLDEEELLKYSKKVADIHKELYKKADDETSN